MDTKNILQSKTIQGVIVMLLASALPLLGWDTSDGDITQIAQAIGVLGGAVLTIIGRVKAKTDLTILPKAKASGFAIQKVAGGMALAVMSILIIGVLIASPGCALKDKTAMEKARITSVASGETYLILHNRYQDLMKTLPSGQAEQLRKAAPYLDTAKRVIVAAQSSEIVAELAANPMDNLKQLQTELHGLLDDIEKAWPGTPPGELSTAHTAVDMLAMGAGMLPGVIQTVGRVFGLDIDTEAEDPAGQLSDGLMARADGAYAEALGQVASAAITKQEE
ncbi:MAG: hypothetical protein KKE73_09660 [Proteobacteria bacterium]|nr:hypothetical protein [Pseudomonadota bacterium]